MDHQVSKQRSLPQPAEREPGAVTPRLERTKNPEIDDR
jgi:hypothetical protein